MSQDNKSQHPAASVSVDLNPLVVHQVHQFRELYAKYQACENTSEMQVLAKQIDDLAFKIACSVESALDQVESESTKKAVHRA